MAGRGERRGPEDGGRGQETRLALVRAGLKLFARRGFDGTSVRDITRDAGTNLGAVTYHFGSKRGLYEAVLDSGLTPLVDRVGAAADGGGSPLDRMDMVVDAFFDHLAVHPELPHLLLQEVAAGKTPPEAVVSILRRNMGHLQKILADGRDDGSIREAHPVLAAISVASQPIYISVIAPLLREVGGVDLSDPTTRRTVAEHVKTFVRAGLELREETHP